MSRKTVGEQKKHASIRQKYANESAKGPIEPDQGSSIELPEVKHFAEQLSQQVNAMGGNTPSQVSKSVQQSLKQSQKRYKMYVAQAQSATDLNEIAKMQGQVAATGPLVSQVVAARTSTTQ